MKEAKSLEHWERQLVNATVLLHCVSVNRRHGRFPPSARWVELVNNNQQTAIVGILRHRARLGDLHAQEILRLKKTKRNRSLDLGAIEG